MRRLPHKHSIALICGPNTFTHKEKRNKKMKKIIFLHISMENWKSRICGANEGGGEFIIILSTLAFKKMKTKWENLCFYDFEFLCVEFFFSPLFPLKVRCIILWCLYFKAEISPPSKSMNGKELQFIKFQNFCFL